MTHNVIKNLSKAITLLLTILLTTISCSKMELQDQDDWVKVCTRWGTTSAQVKNLMKTYKLLSSSSGVIVYKGKGNAEAISYKFVSDSLCATAVVMRSANTSLSDIRSTFSNYEKLGEYNSNELFINGYQLVTIKEYIKAEVPYIAIGYIPFNTNE